MFTLGRNLVFCCAASSFLLKSLSHKWPLCLEVQNALKHLTQLEAKSLKSLKNFPLFFWSSASISELGILKLKRSTKIYFPPSTNYYLFTAIHLYMIWLCFANICYLWTDLIICHLQMNNSSSKLAILESILDCQSQIICSFLSKILKLYPGEMK